MKKYLFILFIPLFSMNLVGQNGYFRKFINLSNLDNESVTAITKLNDDEILITSTGAFNALDQYNYQMIHRKYAITSKEVLFKKYYTHDEGFTLSPTKPKLNTKGNYIITGLSNHKDYFQLGLDEGNIFICEMTPDGNVLWSKQMGEYPVRDWGKAITQLEDESYIIVGHKNRNTDTNILDAFVTKTSRKGDSLWTTIIADTEGASNWWGRIVEKGPDNTCFVGINRTNDTEPWFDIARIDASDGTILWKKQYPLGTNNGVIASSLSEEGNLILSGSAGETGTNCFTLFFAELDIDGELLWYKSYGTEVGCTTGERFIHTNEGGYATCVRQTYPKLVVVDEQGNFLYSKTYEIEYYMSPTDLVQLEDGSFVIVGYEGATSDYTIWLIKTDPEGDLVLSVGKEIERIPVHVYPNPTTSFIQVELPQSTKQYTARLANNWGQLVETYTENALHAPIYVEHLVSGIYYLNIFEGERLVAVKKVVKN